MTAGAGTFMSSQEEEKSQTMDAVAAQLDIMMVDSSWKSYFKKKQIVSIILTTKIMLSCCCP